MSSPTVGLVAGRTGTDDPHRTAFGPAAGRMARSVSALHLGDAARAYLGDAARAYLGDAARAYLGDAARAYLRDAARAYLGVGDLAAPGRALAHADAVAPAEVRYRPAARTLIAEIAHSGRAATSVARLATLVGLTRWHHRPSGWGRTTVVRGVIPR
ncbi:hypothetical protein ACGFIP_07700 [Micromonospora zamorensis]|uniref:hypothetical protein n=1 Tax=Micromonospora zamorensis TaxID=709883 RepID=UPI00371F6429